MKRLDRYILREFVAPFAAGTVGCIAMVLANLVVKSSDSIFSYEIPWGATLAWLAMRIPVILTLALPVGAMLATSLLVLRLGQHNEITGFRMGGIPARRLFAGVFAASGALALVILLNGELLSPALTRRANAFRFEVMLQRTDNPVKDDATFTAPGATFCHVSRVDRQSKQLMRIIVYRLEGGRPTEALTAETCDWTADGWKLRAGRHYRFSPSGAPVAIDRFDERPIAFADDLEKLWDEDKDPEEMTIAQAFERLRLHTAAGDLVNATRWRYYLHRKFAMPLTCPIFVLLACGICLPGARPGTNPAAGVLVTIVVVFFCNGTINWAKTIALSGARAWLPPTLAAWLHVLIFGALAIWFLRRAEF